MTVEQQGELRTAEETAAWEADMEDHRFYAAEYIFAVFNNAAAGDHNTIDKPDIDIWVKLMCERQPDVAEATPEQRARFEAAAERFWTDLLAAADRNKDGKIAQGEFRRLYQKADFCRQVMLPFYTALFEVADRNDDGKITSFESRWPFYLVDAEKPDGNAAFIELDTDRDGLLTLQDYLGYVKERLGL